MVSNKLYQCLGFKLTEPDSKLQSQFEFYVLVLIFVLLFDII